MRRFVPAAIALVAFTACPLAAAPTVTETLADDASLNAVAAFNAARAWAVGDRGVVLRTIDGGETWTPGETPTDAQLFGVWFLDDRLGWAVGGSIRPHTHESRGVVLRTIDGGARWESIAATPVPRLQTIRMFDAERGVAAGDGGPLDPSGVFTTDNGGRNWRPVASPEAGRWTAGAFGRDPDGAVFGLLVGPRGVAALADRRVRRPIAPSRRGVHAVAVAAEGVAWLVGGRATVRVSRDRGATWASPPTPPPSELAEWFDWRAAAAVPGGVVAVGAPGAVALRSTDGGASWSTSPTGVATPLSAIAMTRDGHGWAVGDYGVIVATHDGGATWRPQRGAGRRAAALVGVATPEQTPCEWLAAAATAEGARTVVGCPFDQGAGANDRLAEAAGSLGAIAATADGSVALRPRERSLEAAALRRLLDARAGGDALNALARTIARWVVSHRPEAIVVPAPDGPHSGAAVVLREAVEAGVELAAAVPSRTGLTPWRPRRRLEFAPLDGDQKTPPGARRLATGRFVAGLGGSPEQHSRTARGLLSGATAPDAYAWRAIDGAPLGGGRSDAPLDALALRRGGDARRTLAITPGRGVERLRRVAQKQRQLRAMLARDGGDPSVWSGQAIQLTGGLDTEAGATLLAELADGYRRTGLSERAAETRYLLARRYPEEPLADAAIVDLVRHYASGERAHASTRSAAAPPAAAPLAN
ncbi:MAG: YCF48-related protein, partial [Planctomycetota bacterium]